MYTLKFILTAKTGAKLPDPVGLQLWLDVPTINKKDPPTYQEYRSDQLPIATPRADQPEELEGEFGVDLSNMNMPTSRGMRPWLS